MPQQSCTEYTLWESLIFYHVGSGDLTRFRLGGNCLDQLSHLTQPDSTCRKDKAITHLPQMHKALGSVINTY